MFFYFSLLSLHIPSFGTITGSRDPSRIVDLAERFILVYSLSLSGPLRCLFRLGQGYVCSCNTTYVLLQHTICALATHRMFSWMTPYGSVDLERFWLDSPRPPPFSNSNVKCISGWTHIYIYIYNDIFKSLFYEFFKIRPRVCLFL